jgi:hypothetical protein
MKFQLLALLLVFCCCAEVVDDVDSNHCQEVGMPLARMMIDFYIGRRKLAWQEILSTSGKDRPSRVNVVCCISTSTSSSSSVLGFAMKYSDNLEMSVKMHRYNIHQLPDCEICPGSRLLSKEVHISCNVCAYLFFEAYCLYSGVHTYIMYQPGAYLLITAP